MRLTRSNISSIIKSNLFKDSFWAVSGNGIANALLLLAGIIIAHILGKTDYGEYGLVKTTMFFIASFASFGLNYTSTKFVAEAVTNHPVHIRSYTNSSLVITSLTSLFLCIILELTADSVAQFLNDPSLRTPLRILGFLIIVRAQIYTLIAILSGLGKFKTLAVNNILGGVLMIILAYPLTKSFGLSGALTTLVVSQILSLVLNYIALLKEYRKFPPQKVKPVKKEIIKVSFPVALHEATYAIFQWSGTLLITKMSTLGELGIYTAAAQWNAIILFIPNILVNVIISNVSKNLQDQERHDRIIKISLISNLVCSAIPFIIILLTSKYITALYGSTFEGLTPVINVMIFSTIFICCSNVFYSEFISNGKTMIVFIGRLFRDSILLLFAYILIKSNRASAAYNFAISTLIASILHFMFFLLCYKIYRKGLSGNQPS